MYVYFIYIMKQNEKTQCIHDKEKNSMIMILLHTLVTDVLELEHILTHLAQEGSLYCSIFRNFNYSYIQNYFKIVLDVWLGNFQGHWNLINENMRFEIS